MRYNSIAVFLTLWSEFLSDTFCCILAWPLSVDYLVTYGCTFMCAPFFLWLAPSTLACFNTLSSFSLFYWSLFFFIICLPLRETYIVFPSVYVCPSVRPSVRKQHCSTLSLRHIPQCDYPILPKCTYSSLVSKQQIAFDYFYSMCDALPGFLLFK